MNRTEYKNNFGREHYERINLVVPKGMKDIIKALASSILHKSIITFSNHTCFLFS